MCVRAGRTTSGGAGGRANGPKATILGEITDRQAVCSPQAPTAPRARMLGAGPFRLVRLELPNFHLDPCNAKNQYTVGRAAIKIFSRIYENFYFP